MPLTAEPSQRVARAAWPRWSALAVALLMVSACAQDDGFGTVEFAEPDTQIDYEVVIEGAPSEEIETLIRQSIALERQRERGAASPAFLRRRAQGDVATVQKILRSRGYYDAQVATEVALPDPAPSPTAPPLEDGGDAGQDALQAPPVDTERAAADRPVATATLRIAAGTPLTLTTHRLQVIETGGRPPPTLDAADLGSPVGRPAEAAGIVAAEAAAVERLRREGRAYAAFRGRDALADLEADTLDVESVIAAGPEYRMGEVTISGAPDVETDYLLSYLPWEPGALFDAAALRDYEQALFDTQLFSGVAVSPPEAPPETPELPIAVELEQAPFRTIALGARFSTDDGPAVRAEFTHRNVLGAGERLTLLFDGAIDEQVAGASLLTPQFRRPGQDLQLGLELRRVEDDKFDELGATLTAGLARELSDRWSVGAGGLVEASLIDEGGTVGETESYLVGLPLFAAYDSTDDPLNATRGQRLRLEATPFVGLFDDEFARFLTLEARGSAYQEILPNERLVLAERGRIGITVAEDRASVPANRRFFSGGGGSVRGYEQDLVGPLDEQNDPEGGLSVVEAGLELRSRIWGDVGGVLFTDAGLVSDDTLPDFAARLQVAAGIGLRYFSPIGPIRLDVAFPINGRDVDDSFQAYFSIGQAF